MIAECFTAFRRLLNRFSVEPSKVPPTPELIPAVFPITNVDDLLKLPKVERVFADISAASGYTDYFTVPDNKRWTVYMLRQGPTSSNSKMRVYDPDTSEEFGITALQTAGEAVFHKFPMNQRWKAQLANTGNGSDTNILMEILYEEEDAY